MAKKIAVVLSGCGNKDGTEITEAVSLLIALSQWGAEVHCFAPNQDFPVTNFMTDQPLAEKRNALLEAARIARSKIQDLEKLNVNEFDALALPGGFGAALNLSSWGREGSRCQVLPALEKAVLEFHKQSKPIGAICIAPAVVARILGRYSVTLTIGSDSATATEIQKTGAIHEDCPVDDYITDRLHKVITTPAYMYDEATPAQVFKGINGLAKELVEMA